MDTPLQKSLSPLLSWIFYALATLLLLMLTSAFFSLPTATSIGNFFFQAFGSFSLYLPIYLILMGLYLQKNQTNYSQVIAINLTFLPFITLVLLWRFLTYNATTDWEIALFWYISKNYRNHFTMVFVILLLIELTLISYFWYRSKTKKVVPPTTTEEMDIEKLHDHINTINAIDNQIEENPPKNTSTKYHKPEEKVLLRVESHLKRSKYRFQETISRVKIALFGAEKADKQWQEEVEDLLDELKQERKNHYPAEGESHQEKDMISEEDKSLTYLKKDAEIQELLEDPMMQSWHDEDHLPHQEEVRNLEKKIENPLSTLHAEPCNPLAPQKVSEIINHHLGIQGELTDDSQTANPEEAPFIPQKLESPQVDVEEDFIKSKEQFDEELLPLHLRDSFFTQEEQDALHAIGEEIVENAELEEQIAELIEEANQTLHKLISNTQITPYQSDDIYQKYEDLVGEQLTDSNITSKSSQTIEEPKRIDAEEFPYEMPEAPLITMEGSIMPSHLSEEDLDEPFVQLTASIEEELSQEIYEKTTVVQPLQVGALPSITEDFEQMEFLQQSLIESELEEAIDSPTTAMEIANYQLPHATLLHGYEETPYWEIDEETEELASILENTLKEFKIEGKVTNISKGPAITMFELLPASGVKLSRIEGLADNIAFRLAAKSVRIVAPIPGKQAVGVEIPNKHRAIVSFKELIDDTKMHDPREIIPVVLGKDIAGDNQVIDLTKTPHLLIAGATGSGKSVSVNALISSILFTRKPTEVRMMLIDPKVVELKPFNDVPHLLTPVITDPKRALQAIAWVNDEMDRRYALLDNLGVRNIAGYNTKIKEMNLINPTLPYLVVVIDEFADLMATSAKELEGLVARLAAKSRAAGIHLVLATQRPSVDVITGLIKANFPSRIAFMVAGKMDSRVILDTNGAEQLLGKGDMLFISSWSPIPTRVQGAFLSDEEVESIADFVKSQGEPNYIDDEIFYDEDEPSNFDDSNDQDNDDVLYEEAVDVVLSTGKTSASYLQRRFKIGYNRAARLIEMMEDRGLLGPANGSKPREILR